MNNIIEIKEMLKTIANKINKIEEKDADYTHNINWVELRGKQDRLYTKLEELINNNFK